MTNPIVSILIPIYKVEKHIEQCVLSILHQTINEDVEIIFVNDCTPDNSIEVLNDTLKNNPPKSNFHIEIIEHDKNRGQSAARNTALNHAKGTYIIFIDSDDYIDSKMIEKMYHKAIKSSASIVMVDLIKEYKGYQSFIKAPYNKNKHIILSSLIRGESIYMCNKLILRALFTDNRLTFKEGYNISEDYAIIIPLCFHANKIEYVPEVYYHYIQYNESATTKRDYTQQDIDSIIYSTEILLNFIAKHKISGFEKDIMFRQLITRSWCMTYSTGEKRKQYACLYPEINKHAFKLIKLSKGKQAKILLYFVAKGYVKVFSFLLALKQKFGI